MFKELRRKDRKLEYDGVIDLLIQGEYGTLATIGSNGYPYVVPLSYVYLDNAVYFHCGLEGHKLDNIKYDNKVSFCVVGEIETLSEKFSVRYESVILYGRASEVAGDEKYNALMALLEKYSGEHIAEGKKYIESAKKETKVIKVTIEQITGKARK